MASDSRLSWGAQANWDLGRKIFPSTKYGDILGYSGDVVFCSQQLSQIVTYIDTCSSFEIELAPESRADMIFNLVKESFGSYPKKFALNSFSILYLTRRCKYDFCAFIIKWSVNRGWEIEKIDVGYPSSLIIADGSGCAGYKSLHKREIETSDFGCHSRGYFYALHRFIESKEDYATGGPPQISCIYNVGPAKVLGTVYKGRRYIFGLSVPNGRHLNNVRWVNETLESIDGVELTRFEDAQPQPIPLKFSGK